MAEKRDPGLDALLPLDGEVFFVDADGRFYVKFVVKSVSPSPERPHGLNYSLTLHDETGERLVGFDIAHAVPSRRGPGGGRRTTQDHRHRLKTMRPYEYRDAATLACRLLEPGGCGAERKRSETMKTLKVGIADYKQYKKRTLAIARGAFKPAADDPKIWFTSVESFAKVLSDKNRELLALIADTQPDSMNELAQASGRAPSNLSRTLRTMERYGLVRFEKRRGRQLAPRVPYTDIVLDMPLSRSLAARVPV